MHQVFSERIRGGIQANMHKISEECSSKLVYYIRTIVFRELYCAFTNKIIPPQYFENIVAFSRPLLQIGGIFLIGDQRWYGA